MTEIETAAAPDFADPQHWSHSRRPRNEAEELELAAALFRPDLGGEIAIIIANAYPELVDQLSRESTVVATAGEYATRRRAAIARGTWQPDPKLAAEVAADVDAYQSLERPTIADDATHRAAFAAAVTRGSAGDAAVAFEAWHRDIARLDRYRADEHRIRARLGFRGAAGAPPAPMPRPTFSAEVDRAWSERAAELRAAERAAPSPAKPTPRRARPQVVGAFRAEGPRDRELRP